MMHVFYEIDGKELTSKYPPYFKDAEFETVYPPFDARPWRRLRWKVVGVWNSKIDSIDLMYKVVAENTLSTREIQNYEDKLSKVIPIKYDPIK